MSNTEVVYLFEELMNVNRELSLAYEELEAYKKALYLACNGQEYLVNDFLQKARDAENVN